MIPRSQNYRKVRDRDGTVITYLIEVDGVPVPVSKEVYQAYAQMERQERYQREREKGLLLSLDQPLPPILTQSPEDQLMEQEEKELQRQQLKMAKATLSLEQKRLFTLLFEQGLSLRACAKMLEISAPAVLHRKRILLRTVGDFLLSTSQNAS